ncbi:MAG TPA: DUF4346 domain-containing protein, partial [Chthonomonadales bacterium]|nr:DUF4346 domain-containing protein [Chthonomonadales bacterium]
YEIMRGMELKKCRRCGCMSEALMAAARAFSNAEAPAVRALLPIIQEQQARMEPLAYDCIGCKKCWGADATVKLAEQFEDVKTEECGKACGPKAADAPVVRVADADKVPWPPYPGDYVVGNPHGSVAVCTLSRRELAASVIEAGDPSIAIAGRCDTENIGVEKVVLNVLANPAIRWLVLCGVEAQGHRAGDAFLHLKEKGVDANMRVLEAASWRPVLKNLTLADVARFREQVEVVNLIGCVDRDSILQAARQAAAKPASPLSDRAASRGLVFERIRARAPERLQLDPAGFFIILPQADGTILLEHYENNGRLSHVVEGRQAALIAATAVERGLVSRLDHAAYLGRELAKAEISLKMGVKYEQDAALGNLPIDTDVSTDTNSICASGTACACR